MHKGQRLKFVFTLKHCERVRATRDPADLTSQGIHYAHEVSRLVGGRIGSDPLAELGLINARDLTIFSSLGIKLKIRAATILLGPGDVISVGDSSDMFNPLLVEGILTIRRHLDPVLRFHELCLDRVGAVAYSHAATAVSMVGVVVALNLEDTARLDLAAMKVLEDVYYLFSIAEGQVAGRRLGRGKLLADGRYESELSAVLSGVGALGTIGLGILDGDILIEDDTAERRGDRLAQAKKDHNSVPQKAARTTLMAWAEVERD